MRKTTKSRSEPLVVLSSGSTAARVLVRIPLNY